MLQRTTDFFRSLPKYRNDSEVSVVDLSEDGIPCIPVLGDTHYSRSGGGTAPHVHPGMIEMLFCRRGVDLSFDCDGTACPFRPGDMFVAQPEMPHFLQRYPKSLAMHWMWFKLPPASQTVLGLSPAETRWLVGRLRELPVSFAAGEPVKRAFKRLWHLYRTVPAHAVERRLLLRTAVVDLLLDIVTASCRPERVQPIAQMAKIVEEMRAHPEACYPVGDLARRSGLSETSFALRFKAATGLPPHAFLLACRMERAKAIMKDGKSSMFAIASSLGFPSAQHFATQFRKFTGLSPRAWRCAMKI